MTTIVTSRSSNMLFSSKDQANGLEIEEDSLIESLPSLYFSEIKKEEEVDTDDDDEILSKPIVPGNSPLEHINASPKSAQKPLLSSSFSHSQIHSITPIQTYLPQLNHSFYSPTSSIRSRNYSISSSSHHSDTPEPPLPPPKRLTPLYSIPIKTPMAAPSSSRIKNAFQKLRPAKPSNNTNSIVPAELISKPSIKHSLADKIRTKFQRLDHKRASLIETSCSQTSTMPRSSSLSSLSNWSARRLYKKKAKDETFALKKSMSSHKLYTHKKTQVPCAELQVSDIKKSSTVQFKTTVSVRETFSKFDYDRASDPDAVCTRLTPMVAQQIKDELNDYKLKEMRVHESSRSHTHFFL